MSNTSRRGSSSPWASDESTENLLGSILEDTLDAATQEAEELDHAIMESTRHQQEEKHAQQLARQRANAQALAKEEDRQRAAEKRRTAALEAIRAGDHVDEPGDEEDALQVTQEAHEPAPIIPATLHPMPSAPQVAPALVRPPASTRRGHTALLATAGALAIALVAVLSLLASLTMTGYHVDQTSYPKTLMQPRSAKDPLTSASYLPIPKSAEPSIPEQDTAPAPRKGTRTHHETRSNVTQASAPAVEKPTTRKDQIKDLFKEDENNIFGTVDKFGSDL